MTKRKYDPNRESWGAVRKLPSGRLQASYVGPDGARHTAPATFDNKTDARAWLGGQRSAIARGTWKSADQLAQESAQDAAAEVRRSRTLSDYAAEWIDQRTGRDGSLLRGTTRAEYTRLLAGPLAKLAPLALSAIDTAAVRDWYTALVKTGRKTTAARAYGLLRSVMHTASAVDHIIPTNPCQVPGAQNATTGHKSDVPTDAELAIIEATMPERLRAMVPLAAWGGLRYGELTELRRGDVVVDDDTVLLNITRAVSRVPGEGFVVGPPKSAAGVRVVALPPQLTSTVLDHLRDHVEPGSDALLFPSKRGGHMAESTFTKSWYAAREAAGRPDLSWHTLRAFAGTRYTQSGATMREVMERLGHSSSAAALRYQRTTGRDAALAARMMSRS